MSKPELPLPLQFLAAWIGLWVGRHQERVIAYQREELRLLGEKLGGRRLWFTDVERMRLARLGKEVGRKALGEVATLASPTRFCVGTANSSRGSTTAARRERRKTPGVGGHHEPGVENGGR